MFRKPYVVKSQVQLKSSEKRKIIAELRTDFPSLTEEDVARLNKETLVRCKITTARDENVLVYILDTAPMFFEVQDVHSKLPTLLMAWDFPHVVPHVTTNSFVLEKLKSGADLFVPGVILEGLHLSGRDFHKNKPVIVNTLQNSACMSVGLACHSSSDMLTKCHSQTGGTAVRIFHVFGDFLCKMSGVKKLPDMGPPPWVSLLGTNMESAAEGIKSTTNDECATPANGEVSAPVANEESVTNENVELACKSEDTESGESKMDDNQLLEYCFIKAAKTAPKTIYPILPATFYATYVLPAAPADQVLNIKKTKWKKFSIYLEDKSLQGLVKLEAVQKNEFKILGFDYSKHEIRVFVDKFDSTPLVVADKVGADGLPVIQQIFSVSAAVLPFFEKQGYRKLDEMTRNDVRNSLNDYIKHENLQHPSVKDKVVLDPILTSILKEGEVVGRGELLAALLDKMKVQHRVSNTNSGDTILHKGKMPLIEFEVAIKTGNKKITRISNMESYGVDVTAFAKELQLKAAASTTICQGVPGKKGSQVIVQGNQITIAAAILREKNIQEKFMRGLDKAPKSKKK